MLLLTFALLAGAPVGDDAGGVTICNGMKVEIASAGFDGVGHSVGPLKPSACAWVGPIPAGDYTLRFIEHAGEQAALCTRRVALKPGDTVRITPKDKSNCIF